MSNLVAQMQALSDTIKAKRAAEVAAQNALHRAQQAAKGAATPAPAPAPTVEQYRAALAAHDWFYEWSDDYHVWKRGQAQRAALLNMRRVVDADLSIWKAFTQGVTA